MQLATSSYGWRTNSLKVVLWFGDAPGKQSKVGRVLLAPAGSGLRWQPPCAHALCQSDPFFIDPSPAHFAAHNPICAGYSELITGRLNSFNLMQHMAMQTCLCNACQHCICLWVGDAKHKPNYGRHTPVGHSLINQSTRTAESGQPTADITFDGVKAALQAKGIKVKQADVLISCPLRSKQSSTRCDCSDYAEST